MPTPEDDYDLDDFDALPDLSALSELLDGAPPESTEDDNDLAEFASTPLETVAPPQRALPAPGQEDTAPAPVAAEPPAERLYRARRAGSDREEDLVAPGAGEVVLDFHRLFQSFYVNWTSTRPYSILGRTGRRAALVGWRVADLKSVEATSRMYQNLARRCPGPGPEERFDAQNRPIPVTPEETCMCVNRYGADPAVWEGYPCPAELLYLFQQFTLYVRDLGIKPQDHVDVQQVLEIVKLHLYEGRCDEILQYNNGSLHGVEVGTLDQRTSTVYWNKRIAVELETQGVLSTRRLKLYDKLIASRDTRAKRELAEMKAGGGPSGGQMTPGMMMAELNAININKRRETQILDASQNVAGQTPAIDADFRSEELTTPAPDAPAIPDI